jgi:hypothetical protein
MGRTLDIHPLIVLVVTALGGVIGGIVGLILAVPFFVIARNAIAHPSIQRRRRAGRRPRQADRATHTRMTWAAPVTHAHNPQVDIAATAQTCGR